MWGASTPARSAVDGRFRRRPINARPAAGVPETGGRGSHGAAQAEGPGPGPPPGRAGRGSSVTFRHLPSVSGQLSSSGDGDSGDETTASGGSVPSACQNMRPVASSLVG